MRQEAGRAKEKQKLVGKAKHHFPTQWLHSYHQAHEQKVFSWHKDHFKSLRVYNLTASGLDSLSVYKYCTDTGRHFPPFLPGKGRGQCATFPPLHLLICTAEVTVLAKSHLPVKLHLRWQFILPDFNGEILLGKLTLILYNLKYKHLLYPSSNTFAISPNRCPQDSFTVFH